MKDKAAFPLHDTGHGQAYDKGMTLRDYFAAKAMQGLLAGLLANGMDIKWQDVAEDAHRMADAMMKAREA